MLEKQGVLINFEEGQDIFKEGSYGEEMYVIKSGMVEIFRQRDGMEVSLAKLNDGEFFGELAFFGNYPRSASARALKDSNIYVIDKSAFMSLVNDNVVWLILKRLGERFRKVDDQLEQLMVKDHKMKEALSTIVQRRQFT